MLYFMGHDAANLVQTERTLLGMIQSRSTQVGKCLRCLPVSDGSLQRPKGTCERQVHIATNHSQLTLVIENNGIWTPQRGGGNAVCPYSQDVSDVNDVRSRIPLKFDDLSPSVLSSH